MAGLASPSTVSSPVVSDGTGRTGIEYERLVDCIHCGLCLSSCPTYLELGTEMDSPRGRIYLMRAVSEGRAEADTELRMHLDLCLDCRACESACPSGVQYGKLIEPFRVYLNSATPTPSTLSRLQRLVLFHVFPYARRARLALGPIRFMQWTGLHRLLRRIGAFRLLPRGLRNMYEMLPRLSRHYGRLPEVLPAIGKRRACVALFTGCVADSVFPETTLATARVLQHNGCEVWVPPGQTCCGAIHYHTGNEPPAHRFAAANCETLANSIDSVDAIVVNAAGCGAMLKDYAYFLRNTSHAEAGSKLAAKARDISEFLGDLGAIPPTHPLPIRAVYHDPCHLCHGQQVRQQPRQLLGMIPGLTLLPLQEHEICCGAAGTYNLTQPEMAERLGERKVRNILATGTQALFTGNVGCLMQIGRHLGSRNEKLWVAHPVDALWASYSGDFPATLRELTQQLS